MAANQQPTSLAASKPRQTADWPMRVDLAAAFRLAARNQWHEAVANHFSLAVSDDGRQFLMNPRWRHFSRIRARDLQLLNSEDAATMQRPDAPDPSAWCIHGALHAARPQARCIMHVHSPYATAIACLADPTILPIDQNTARFHGRVAIDLAYGGIVDDRAEGHRMSEVLGDRKVMLLGNHGVLVVGTTVAETYDTLYYLEMACRTLVLAYSTQRPLNVMSDALAAATARDWEQYPSYAQAHFDEMKKLLDSTEPDYAE